MKIVEYLKLNNFRCHKEFLLNFNEKSTLIIGKNGSGKTSILEAVYLGLRGKSFKGTDREILRNEAKFFRVEISKNDGQKIIIRFDGENKNFEVDVIKKRRLPKKNHYPVVLFEPDDLHLISSSPSRRRNYFDEFFKQIDEKYAVAAARYQKALKQRNDLLKNEFLRIEDMFSWNILCAEYGAKIAKIRAKLTRKINENLTKNYQRIAQNEDKCEILYQGQEISENKYLEELERNFKKDRVLGYTSFGVHRDDYEFLFNGKKADGSASRGEIRSVILAMKFIEAQILEEELEKQPIILLDDIFSELDEGRQRCLIENFRNFQMIITSTTAPKKMEVNIKL